MASARRKERRSEKERGPWRRGGKRGWGGGEGEEIKVLLMRP